MTVPGRPTMADVALAAATSRPRLSRESCGERRASARERTSGPGTGVPHRSSGYIVNGVASSMRSRQTRTVGLVMADVTNPWFGQLAGGVESVLGPAGFSVILANTNNSVERERAAVQTLLQKQVDALVVASSSADGAHLQ